MVDRYGFDVVDFWIMGDWVGLLAVATMADCGVG